MSGDAAARAIPAAPSETVRLLDAARARYDAADYAGALALLAFAPPAVAENVGALLLRAKAAIRTNDLVTADDAASRAAAAATTPDERVLAFTTAAVVLRSRKLAREASVAFDRAAASLPLAGHEARAEYAYQTAVVAWEEGDVHAAETIVDAALADAHGAGRAMLVQLLGWVEVRRERYARAAERFAEALAALDEADRDDARLRARLLHALAFIASETIDLELARRYDDAFTAFPQATGVARERFNTLTCMRFVALLRGDRDAAWLLSREAVAIAPTPAFRAIAETNAAVVSALVGDAFAAELQLRTAREIIQGVSWSAADDEERVALTNFAIEAAATMPAEARSAVTLYRSVTGRTDARLAITGDRRMQAFEATAAGRIAETVGKTDDAVANYAHALQLWIALDYRMRAALVARDLVRLTNDERRRHDLDVALSRAPRAWFGSGTPAHAARSPLAELTNAERTVLRHLLGGDGMREIAETLGRSTHTVHNHTRRIFAAFDVRKRAALVARCAELGITPDRIAP